MAKVTFKTDLCKGCGLCVDACPKQILHLAADKINKKGHHPAELTDEAACVGCAADQQDADDVAENGCQVDIFTVNEIRNQVEYAYHNTKNYCIFHSQY